MSGSEPVTLNVGGQRFSTLAATLRRFPESRLARMLEGGDVELRPRDGFVFIDRDGALFVHVLEFLRTRRLALPPDFRDYERLRQEADFYELPALAELLGPERAPRLEVLELRFQLQDARAFFRLFGSCSATVEALAARISLFVEQPSAAAGWGFTVPASKPLAVLPVQRPSHHDLVFQCGADYSVSNQFGARYVSIKPDQRKLVNGTNVLGLLIDILLKEGFRLMSTRTVSSEEKIECYIFERMKRPEILILTEDERAETSITSQAKPAKANKKR
ncbi:potassium channel regulatory protein [Microcaecilia unicolor]|uniref:Potassium channel regulatory protein n=1 Tax=Microcaecilia unicolor TaxID=1415580 RepID=A0A6P7XTI3_9AMPH|nr:potassium channel regulatory protein [Microcaecilia unicolor]